MTEAEMLEAALDLALRVHRGQTDRKGAPYILHPIRVMSAFLDAPRRVVAVLHDVVEDGDVTLADLEAAGFPSEIVGAIDALTRREGESYEAFVERASAHPLARAVKLADVEDNLDLRRLDRVGERDLERLNRYLAARRSLLAEHAPIPAASP